MQLCSIGGLTENGKKTYFIEVNNEYIIFDCGCKEPSVEDYGISKVIPDLEFFQKNKSKIKSIFITNISTSSVGALENILDVLNDKVNIYGSDFTISFLKVKFPNKKNIFKTLYPKRTVSIDQIKITPFFMTFSIPGNYGFLVNISQKNIIFATNYSFYNDIPINYYTDIDFLSSLKYKNRINFLVTSVEGIEQEDKILNTLSIQEIFETYIIDKERGNVFLNIKTENLLLLQKVLEKADKKKIPVKIVGKRGRVLLKHLIFKGALKLQNNILLSPFQKTKKEKILYIILGDDGYPYKTMNGILDGLNKDITVNDKDIILLATSVKIGKELKPFEIINKAFKRNIYAKNINLKEIYRINANIEDMAFLNKLSNPHFIIPVNNEYRNLIKYKKLFEKDKKNIILLKEGDILDLKQVKVFKNKIRFEDTLISGSYAEKKENKYLKQREKLAHDGIIIVNVIISLCKENILFKKMYYKSCGFSNSLSDEEVSNKIKQLVVEEINSKNEDKENNLVNIKNILELKLNELISKDYQRTPILEIQFTTV